MKTFAFLLVPAISITAFAACSDETGSGGAGGATGSTTGAGNTTPASSGANGSTNATTTTTTTNVTSTADASSSTGLMFDCNALSDMPTVTEVGMGPFDGSEDFTFDGKGNMVGKKGGNVVKVDAAGTETQFAALAQGAFGLRFATSGNLIVALPGNGKIVELAEGAAAVDYATGLNGANGIFPDADGNVWATEFQGGRVIKIDTNKVVTELTSANAPNGVLYDETRGLVFYTEYQSGNIFRINPDGSGEEDIEQLLTAAPDGLAMDACGHLYVVDNGQDRLYRIRLDAAGNNLAMTEEIAEFDASVANASFGQGPGFDPLSLYVAGGEGRVFRVEIGAPGAPVVLPP